MPEKHTSDGAWILFLMVMVFAIALTLVYLGSTADAADLRTRAHWGWTADSVWATKDTNGVVIDSNAIGTSLTGHDTTWADVDKELLAVTYYIFDGDDYQTWAWVVDNRIPQLGSGTHSVDYTALDTTNDETITGALVTVYDEAESDVVGWDHSNSSGVAEFTLDTGSYVVVVTGYQRTWPTHDTHTVTGATTDTIQGYYTNPTAPTGADLCTVYGYLRDIVGDSISGRRFTITLSTDEENTCDSSITWRYAVSGVTDANGKFSENIVKSKCWDGGGLYTLSIEGIKTTYTFFVPDQSTWKFLRNYD